MDNNISSIPISNDISTQNSPNIPKSNGFKQYKQLFLIGILLFIFLVGLGGYFLGKNSNTPANISTPTPSNSEEKACTLEAKICPDGTSVGRVGPNCEFAPCPTVKSSTSTVISNGSCVLASSAALQGLPNFLQAIPDYQGKVGTVGKSYIVYSVDNIEKLASYTKGQKVASLISPTQMCYFTVLINNVPTTDLNMENQSNGWQAVGIGGTLTKKVSDLEKQIPGFLQKNGINGIYSLKLTQIRPMNLDFALIEADGKEFIASFSPPNWFNLEENTLYTADEAMTHYIQPAKDQINNNRSITGGN